MKHPHTPLVLCILDGWGCRPAATDNAITQAHTPHWNGFLQNYPHTTLQASETFVGLPHGQMGNSEVGHMTIGTGCVIDQDLVRIDKSVNHDTFKQEKAFQDFCHKIKAQGGHIHVMGLLSDGGVHSHINHFLYVLKQLDALGIHTFVHAFLDGRDTPPRSALKYISMIPSHMKWGTIMGRFYGMDRDKRWDRTQKAHDCMMAYHASCFENATDYVLASYDHNVTDEFVEPACHKDYPGIQDNDGILMVNFRADRVRQLLQSFLVPTFQDFPQNAKPQVSVVGMTSYSAELDPFMNVIFPIHNPTTSLGSICETQGLRQLRIAETEKYAHVTFFLNGGREEPYQNEERILIPSPQVKTYDEKPEMSAFEMTDVLVKRLDQGLDDIVIINFANTDMVGHTGNQEATQKAVEAVDQCLGKIAERVRAKEGVLIITADHGNAEVMQDGDHHPHTAHTCNVVPFVLVSESHKTASLHTGTLADITPTILRILGIKQPEGMGKSLLTS